MPGGYAAWLLPSTTMPRVAIAPLIGLAYILSLAGIGELHGSNIVLGTLGLLDVYNAKTRQFLRTFLPCIITGAIYDSFRFTMPPLTRGHVHVAGPYFLDRALFGVGGHTLNEVFAAHHWAAADLIAGFAYLGYVAEFMGLTLLLFFRRDVVRALTFARGFLVVNLLGFVTYIAYPAAPPWYVAEHGFGPAQMRVAASPGAAVRFDRLLGTHVFRDVYSHCPAVFGALPSLHAAYPALALLLLLRMPTLRWARWPACAYALVIACSAVYLQHHYVIDVLLGWTYAVITAVIVGAWERVSVAATARPPAHHSA